MVKNAHSFHGKVIVDFVHKRYFQHFPVQGLIVPDVLRKALQTGISTDYSPDSSTCEPPFRIATVLTSVIVQKPFCLKSPPLLVPGLWAYICM